MEEIHYILVIIGLAATIIFREFIKRFANDLYTGIKNRLRARQNKKAKKKQDEYDRTHTSIIVKKGTDMFSKDNMRRRDEKPKKPDSSPKDE